METVNATLIMYIKSNIIYYKIFLISALSIKKLDIDSLRNLAVLVIHFVNKKVLGDDSAKSFVKKHRELNREAKREVNTSEQRRSDLNTVP